MDHPVPESNQADVIVIGGGIAGVSAAYQLAGDRSVILLEREAQLAHHTTGRSAAVFIVNYGGPIAQRLTVASREFFEHPPGHLVDGPILEPRGLLMTGTAKHANAIEASALEGRALDPTIEVLETAEILAMIPVLRAEAALIGMYEPGASIMDVMGLHQAFVRGARAEGATLARYERVTGIERMSDSWRVVTDRDSWQADVIVNAAGAWGDEIGSLAGAAPLGLAPLRRTAFTVAVDHDTSEWPFVHIDTDDGACYFKRESGDQLMCSPADETPSVPCDAKPDELDIAIAIDRINTATTLDIRSVRTTWAGLRSFVPDRQPVLGWDDEVPAFCWMVGQGGTGITTSHASGRVIASVVDGSPLPADLTDLGLTKTAMAPRRGGVH